MDKGHTLIIAFEFYPYNLGGSHRPFEIASFLKNQNFPCIVISGFENGIESFYDESLQQKLLDSGLEHLVIPLKAPDLLTRISKSYYFNFYDDIWRRWKTNLKAKLKHIATEKEVSNIIVSVPPFSVVKVIPLLKKIFKNDVKVVLDMRDAWSSWNVSPYASKWHYKQTLKQEKSAFRHANAILFTSQVSLNDAQDNHPEIEKSKFHFISNSFESFRVNTFDTKRIEPKEKIRICYTGSFYYSPSSDFNNSSPWYKKRPYRWFQFKPYKEEWIYRSPYFLLQCISTIIRLNPEYRDSFEIVFAGRKQVWLEQQIKKFNLTHCAKQIGFLPKSDILSFLLESDFLLLTSSKREGKKDYSIAGKTYEYFSVLKPILAFVPAGAQRDILSDSGLAIFCDPDDIFSSTKTLINLIENGFTLKPNLNYLQKYQRDFTLSLLIKILN